MEAASRALKLNCVNSCRTTAYFIGVQQEKNAVTIWGARLQPYPIVGDCMKITSAENTFISRIVLQMDLNFQFRDV